jgi:hypothetical protein
MGHAELHRAESLPAANRRASHLSPACAQLASTCGPQLADAMIELVSLYSCISLRACHRPQLWPSCGSEG